MHASVTHSLDNSIVMNAIMSTISENILQDILVYENAAEVWSHLEDRFLGSSLDQAIGTTKYTSNLKFINMDELISNFRRQAAALKNAEPSIRQRTLAIMFLSNIPPDFQQFSNLLVSQQDTDILDDLDKVLQRFKQLVPRSKRFKKLQSSRTNTSKKNQNNQRIGRNPKKGKGKGTDEANTGQTNDAEDEQDKDSGHNSRISGSSFIARVRSSQQTGTSFIVDSGASCHICSQR